MARRVRRRALAAVGALALLGATAATSSAQTVTQTVADGAAVAFTLRPAYDMGGAEPLALYVGYTAANVTTPDPEADGQASWYNLGILETGLFLPPEQCTPEKNLAATVAGAQDLQLWLAGWLQEAAGKVAGGQVPGAPMVPGFRHACTERFPGFAQSRYPATSTLPVTDADNFLDKPTAAQVCRQEPTASACTTYRQLWPLLHGTARAALQDGSFAATSTNEPSQRSEAVLLGAGDGVVLSVGTARSTSSAHLKGDTLVVESSASLDDVCLGVVNAVCALRIDHLRQYARVVKSPGQAAQRSSGTVVTGVHGTGLAQDLDAASLGPGAAGFDLGDSLHLAPVSQSGSCSSGRVDPSVTVADAGGLLLTARSAEAGQGGGILLGGACARARVERTSFDVGGAPEAGPAPPQAPAAASEPLAQPTVSGPPPAVGPAPALPVTAGAPRTVTRTVTSYRLQDPLAWRTVAWWGPLLGLVLLAGLAGRLAPRHPLVAPLSGATDRFLRRFLRG
jgi:hypothetical protein